MAAPIPIVSHSKHGASPSQHEASSLPLDPPVTTPNLPSCGRYALSLGTLVDEKLREVLPGRPAICEIGGGDGVLEVGWGSNGGEIEVLNLD